MNKPNRNKSVVIFLVMIAFFVMFSVNVYSVNIAVCTNMNVRGQTYTLTADIDNAAATCMQITAHNVIFDCQGHYIDGQNNGNGIDISGVYENATVQNCEVYQFESNINSLNNINLTVENTSVYEAGFYGFSVSNLKDGNFINIYINDSARRGFNFLSASKSQTNIYNLTILNTNSGSGQRAGFYSYTSTATMVLNLTLFNFSNNAEHGFYDEYCVGHLHLSDGFLTNNVLHGLFKDGMGSCRYYFDNLTILNNNIGFQANYVDFGYLNHSIIRNNGLGVYFDVVTNFEINNNVITDNNNYGLTFNTDNDDCTITNNTITNNSILDVRINNANCNDNIFWNNIFQNNNTNVSDAGTDTKWNTSTGGNNWTDFNEPSEGCFDTDNDGFCDNGNVSIDADSYDLKPLYDGDLFKCGYNVTTNLKLAVNMDCNNTALNLAADNIKLDCSNNKIIGDGAGIIGLKINSTNVTIIGCNIINFTTNLYADPGVGLVVENNSFVNSSNCTILEAYNSSIIRNNSYYNCTDNAILLINESNHNRIYNNTINFSWIGVNIRNGTNNTVWNNSFTNSLHAHANSIIGNNFNSSVGNYWDDILSLKIFDTDADGLGDAGSEYPYNNTNNANVTGLVNDYRPFTTKNPGKFLVNITAPLNDSVSNTSNVNITCEVNSSDNVNNLTFIIWDVTGAVHQTNSTNPAQPNITLTWEATLSDGNYTAGCNATNVLSQRNLSDNHTFRVDTARPLVQLISPADLTSTTTTNNSFIFEANDSTLMNCSLLIDRNHAANFTGLQNGTYSSDEELAIGVHRWNVTCVDEAGWSNTSDTWTITITAVPPPAGGAGGGGGAARSFAKELEKEELLKQLIEKPSLLEKLIKEEQVFEEAEEEAELELEMPDLILPKKRTLKLRILLFFVTFISLALITFLILMIIRRIKRRITISEVNRELTKFKKAFGMKK